MSGSDMHERQQELYLISEIVRFRVRENARFAEEKLGKEIKS
jgi:hypothetical protein